jgi:hypothetical protein
MPLLSGPTSFEKNKCSAAFPECGPSASSGQRGNASSVEEMPKIQFALSRVAKFQGYKRLPKFSKLESSTGCAQDCFGGWAVTVVVEPGIVTLTTVPVCVMVDPGAVSVIVVGVQVEAVPGSVMVAVVGPGHTLVVGDGSGPLVVDVVGVIVVEVSSVTVGDVPGVDVVVVLRVTDFKKQGHALDSFDTCDVGPQLLRNAGIEAVAVAGRVVDSNDVQKLYALASYFVFNSAR